MKISACYIVKDEEKTLARSVESLRDFVDEIIVVDTGSKDRTVKIAKKFGAKIFHKPWNNDFSEVRNYAISRASGDWIIFLDADEFFTDETRGNIRAAVDFAEQNAKNAILIPLFNIDIDDGNRVVDRIIQLRIFKNLPTFKYVGRIHEQLTGDLDFVSVSENSLSILHTGYSANIQAQKAKRNLDLLIAELEQSENPEDLFGYIAEAYFGLGNHEQAVRFALLDVADGRKNTNFASRSHRTLIKIFREYPDRFIDRYAVTKSATKLFPELAEFWADLGECYGLMGQIDRCIETLEKSIEVFNKYDPNMNFEPSDFNSLTVALVKNRIEFWKNKR